MEAFVSRRLLAVDAHRLEVAHEALLTSWPRLARWLDDDAAGRAVRRHLAPAALEWDRDGRPPDELYRGARLAPALEWATESAPDLTPLERDFVEASRAWAEAELGQARQRVRRTRRLAAGLAIALVAALVAAGLAVRYQRNADARAADADVATTVADANRLAALSTTVGPLDLSLLLAAEAVRTANTAETQDGLLATLVEHRRAVLTARLGDHASDAALADGGRTLFVTLFGAAASVGAWPVGTFAEPQTVFDQEPDDIDGSPTDDLVALSWFGDEGGLLVHDATGRELLALEGSTLGGAPADIVFTQDGRHLLVLLVTDAGPTVRELDLTSRAWRTIARANQITGDDVSEAAFSDDASAVVVWTEEEQPRPPWSTSGRVRGRR